MAAQGVSEIIPLLISCSLDVLKETPLQSNQAVDFYDYQRFVKMICDIAEEMEYRERTEDEKNVLIKAQYEHLKRDLTQTLKRLRDIDCLMRHMYILMTSRRLEKTRFSLVRQCLVFLGMNIRNLEKV